MLNRQRFLQSAAAAGLTGAEGLFDSLDIYAEELVAYNEKVNLTAITAPEEMEEKHFIDCLLFAAQNEVQGSLVDVGTGAGFPGVVAKLYKPELQLTLMEPTGKRLDFLRHLCTRLNIEAKFVKERAEEAARKEWREAFDVATARAVASLPVLCEYCLPLVKKGGLFIAMKGGKSEEGEAEHAVKTLGGVHVKTLQYTLPQGEARRLVFYKKDKPTPIAYPRAGGKIAKKPL